MPWRADNPSGRRPGGAAPARPRPERGPQVPRGEDHGPEDRAVVLIDHQKSAHLLIISGSEKLFSVPLPGLVGPGRASRVRLQPGALPGPAISRPSRTSGGATAPRGRSVPAALEAPGPGSSRPPGRMLAASFQVGPRHVGGRGLTDWRSTIIGCDPLGAPAAKPPEEATNRRATQPK